MSNPYDPGSSGGDPYGKPPGGDPYGGTPGGPGAPGPYGAPPGPPGPPAGGSPYGPPSGGSPYGGGGHPPYGSYGQSGAYGDALPKRTDAVSITGFVLSLTCCLSVVGAVLGFIGLSRTSGGKRKGRWAAVAASIIGVLGTLAAVGIGIAIYMGVDQLVTVDEAEQGLCVNVDDGDEDAVLMYERECTETHDAEIVYAGDAGADADRLETADVGQVCFERVTAETPELADTLSQGDYELAAVIEDPADVQSGDTLVCYVEPRTGDLDEPLSP